ncbi:MAG: response regulator transcription factor [Roseivirga sp.]|nr:response regulator transcription factor [Roseivirga sp.]
MNNSLPPILLVEDDQDLGNILAEYLRIKGYEVELVNDGETAITMLQRPWLIIILDIALPGISGFDVAEKVRKSGQTVPFIFLTAKGQKKDRIHGLKLGADDYITKPFEVEELLLRVQNILKRSGQQAQSVQQMGNLILDRDNLSLVVDNRNFDLTEKEAHLLALFIDNQGQLLKRDYLLNQVWGDDDYFNGRSMDVFISRIRKYLSTSPNLSLVNIRGVGFKLVMD